MEPPSSRYEEVGLRNRRGSWGTGFPSSAAWALEKKQNEVHQLWPLLFVPVVPSHCHYLPAKLHKLLKAGHCSIREFVLIRVHLELGWGSSRKSVFTVQYSCYCLDEFQVGSERPSLPSGGTGVLW